VGNQTFKKEIEMKKLIFAVALIGVLIGSTLGGIALSDGGGVPNYGSSHLLLLAEIKEDTSDILDFGLNFLNTEKLVQGIDGKVEYIQDDITNIKTAQGNMTVMETLSGNATVYDKESISFVYPEVRHVSLTMNAVGIEEGDFAQVEMDFYVDEGLIAQGHMDPLEYSGYIETYEFNTDRWRLYIENNTGKEVVIFYYATITYPYL
jgi:hypothetical protein